jgi:Pectate lyase superfamily protein
MINRKQLLLFPLILLLVIPAALHAQAWSGMLDPARGIDWSTAGVVGGIPNRTTICSSLTPSASLSQINSALAACPSGQVVLLAAGTYNISGTINVPSNVTLRGAGTLKTILNATGSGGSVVQIGNGGPNYNSPASATILSGATTGSSSITVSSASGISTGTLLAVSEINDPTYVTIVSPAQGTCTFCDGTSDGGVRARGQIVQVTSVSGTTVKFTPALYSNYGIAPGTGPALVYPFAPSVHDAGVELLQVYANNSGYGQTWGMTACANCWIKGVFDNYTDGDHASIYWSYHVEIRDSYFSNAYLHGPGTYDSDIDIAFKTSASLLENNIFERLHVGNFTRWGAAGNVMAYNYEIGNFDASATSVQMSVFDDHGAHPQFNLYEGNVGSEMTKDSFWGSSSNTAIFRNHFRGTDTLASPLSTGRNVVNWSSTTLANQQVDSEQLSWPHTTISSIGNVLGSADAIKASGGTKFNSGAAPFTSTIVPPASRNYSGEYYAVSIGYDTGADTNGGAVTSFAGGVWVGRATGSFIQHGDFDIASNAVIWNGSMSQTLPSSFYRSSKPAWFGSVPWPPIGPDVTGGNVDTTTLAGHVNEIPAERCYNNTTRDAAGLKVFDPTGCYGASSSSSNSGAPAPPTGLTVTVQ